MTKEENEDFDKKIGGTSSQQEAKQITVGCDEIKKFLKFIRTCQTIREGSREFRIASTKDPSLDRRSFGRGYELGMYYAIDSLLGTEWVEEHLETIKENPGPAKRSYGDLSDEERRKLDEELAAIPVPKIRIEIETGIFAPFVKLFSWLGLCKMKERVQAENPDNEVFYDYE